jgi:hypothetical protein
MANTGSAALVTTEGLFMFKRSVRRERQNDRIVRRWPFTVRAALSNPRNAP